MATTGQMRFEGSFSAQGLRVGVVAARFNRLVVDALVLGAQQTWAQAGGAADDLELAWVPGAFELPIVAQRMAQVRKLAAVVVLGAVIRGDTPHFDHVAGQAAAGTMGAGLATGVPVVFGVLTCDTTEQALARAGLKAGNKGAEAMMAAIETARVLRSLVATV